MGEVEDDGLDDEDENEIEDEEGDDEDENETNGRGKKNKTKRFKGPGEEKQFRNQNQVREAVHALLAMENRTGGIGQQVSAIARNFNNGLNKTLQAEEKIQNRGGLRRLFAGGDEGAAEEIEEQVMENEGMIEDLEDVVANCDCGEEVKVQMKEQIQIMLQENERLQQLAQEEKKSKGLFGWLWK